MVNLNTTPHMRSILGRSYHQLLTDPEITAPNPQITPPLEYNHAKSLHGKRKDKITWSHTVSQYPDILANYETQLSTVAEEVAPTNGNDQYPPPRPTPLIPPDSKPSLRHVIQQQTKAKHQLTRSTKP